MEVSGQIHVPTSNPRYHLDMRMNVLQIGRYERENNSYLFPESNLDFLVIQPVA
jgi:hypothetical protein